MRKRIIIGTTIALIIVLTIIGMLLYESYQPPDSIKEMIIDNKSSYDGVANFYYSDFREQTENRVTYSFISEDTVFCYQDTTRSIRLDENVIRMFYVVDDSYYIDDKGVDRVYVYDNFVSLCNVDGRKSIVYSVDGTKPKWIDCPGDESPKIRIIQITKNWYYIELVEKWGTGIPRLFAACEEYGLPKPELIDFDGDFRVNMYRKRDANTETNIETNTENVGRIIRLMGEQPSITVKMIAQ